MEQFTIYDLKTLLKQSAINLRDMHRRRKLKNLKPGESQSSSWKTAQASREHRHHHIAYCELRGTPREQIENPREDNKANENIITEIKAKYGTPIHTDQTELAISLQCGTSGACSSAVASS
jgi:hypothetical protein